MRYNKLGRNVEENLYHVVIQVNTKTIFWIDAETKILNFKLKPSNMFFLVTWNDDLSRSFPCKHSLDLYTIIPNEPHNLGNNKQLQVILYIY